METIDSEKKEEKVTRIKVRDDDSCWCNNDSYGYRVVWVKGDGYNGHTMLEMNYCPQCGRRLYR